MKGRIISLADEIRIAHTLRFQFRNIKGLGREEDVPFRERQTQRPFEIVPIHRVIGRIIYEFSNTEAPNFTQGRDTNNLAALYNYCFWPLSVYDRHEPIVFAEMMCRPPQLPSYAAIEIHAVA